MDFSSYRKLGESDLLILKVSIGEMLSAQASSLGSSAAFWVVEDIYLLEDYLENGGSVFAFAEAENSWRYLDDGNYVVLAFDEERGGKIKLYFETTYLFLKGKNQFFEIKGDKEPEPYYLEVYVEETLATRCCDPEMRVSMLL